MAETPLKRGITIPWRSQALERLLAGPVVWGVALLAVLLLGGLLRFHGQNWDRPEGAEAPLQMHPDERFMSMISDRIDWPSSVGEYFNTAESPLNPYNAPDTPSFVYGSFPLYLAKGVATVAGDDSYDQTVVWGRRITALFDVATIAVVFALGAVLFGRRTGLAAALLYALAVLPTQLSHFWAADPYLVFFSAATLLCTVLFVRAEQRGMPWVWGMLAGASIGLAVACKVNGLVLVPVFGLGVLARIAWRDIPGLGLRWGGAPRPSGHWMTDLSVLCLSLAFGIIVFRIAQPYAFEGPNFWDMSLNQQWVDDIQRERDFQDGNVDYPPFVQFAGRTPVLRPLEQIVLWGLGPALGLAAWAAVGVAAVLLFKRRELRFLLPLVAIAAVMAFQGPRFVAFMRYFAPIYPALCLMAGWGAIAAWSAVRERTQPLKLPSVPLPRLERLTVPPRWARAAVGVGLIVLFGSTAFWAFAFQNVYRETHPRLAASKWIYDNLPPGTTITGEFWDDTIPYPLPGKTGWYQIVETEPYQTDSVEKVQQLIYGRGGGPEKAGLEGADYVAITSNRVRDSVNRLEREYPATIRYYELLDSGELGFDKVASFNVYPSFLGISINDTAAEESFTVYDHPHVDIYKKSDRWDAERALQLLLEAHPERAVNLLPKQGRTNGLQFTPEQAEVQQSGGTFADIFSADGPASTLPWLWWLLWVQLAAFATVPWLTWVFRAMPDRGYGLSKLAGFVSAGLVTWLLVAWGGPHFSAGLVWTVFFGVLAVGVALGYARRAWLLAEARERWRLLVAVEAVFLAVFAFFLVLRYANPDLWHFVQGGEKPMDLAYLTAVAKSSTLPPYDPWFANGVVNYYYMGWFLVAVPLRALHLLPEVAYNLAIPTFAGMTATVAFSTVYNLVGLSAGRRAGVAGVVRQLPLRGALVAGVFGVVLLVFASNMDSAHQWVERLQAVNTWGGAWGTGESGAWEIPLVGEVLRAGARVAGGTVGVIGGLWQYLFHGEALRPWDWWRASRVHPPAFDITEFPYWTFLFGDLHPHMMGLPFFGLVIAVAVAYLTSAVRGLRAQATALAVLLGIALGLVRTIHTWDFPTAVVLGSAAIIAGQILASGRWQTRWWLAAGHLALTAGVLLVAFSPYTSNFELSDPGLVRARETTALRQYLAHFGLFLAFAAAFLALRTYEELRARKFEVGRNPVLATVAGPWELFALTVFLLGLTAFTWRFGLTSLALSAVLVVFFANLVWLEFRAPERDIGRLLATALFAAGIGVSAGVDVVNLRNDIVRMNTVFKFGLQAWQLLALASAYAGWYVGSALFRVRGRRLVPRSGRRVPAVASAATAVLLLFAASLYLWPGTAARQSTRFAETGPTLDGLAYMEHAKYFEDAGTPDPADDSWLTLSDDAAIIRWLRENVQGSPVVAEAVGPLYHWTGRISVNTGLPSVVGWDWHTTQNRLEYSPIIQQRHMDTQAFFRSQDVESAEEYIRKYNVSYVVVGTEEWVHGTAEGLSKFRRMNGLREVYREGMYAIYEVDDALRNSTQPVSVLGPPAAP